MLAPGDAADIVGHVREQDGFFVLEPRSSGDVTPRGTGVVPPPVLVAVAELEPDQETARAYEGVSVRVEAVTVTQPDACDGEFVVDDTLHIDDRFVVDALPSTTKGQVLPAIAGVLIHGPSIYKLAPPDAGAFE
jgi:hypothetical protein